jgi:hypothetical protein
MMRSNWADAVSKLKVIRRKTSKRAPKARRNGLYERIIALEQKAQEKK